MNISTLRAKLVHDAREESDAAGIIKRSYSGAGMEEQYWKHKERQWAFEYVIRLIDGESE